jgi:hypothetical protein
VTFVTKENGVLVHTNIALCFVVFQSQHIANIMERVVVLHQTIYEMHRKKQDDLILKIDFEKAYDKLN